MNQQWAPVPIHLLQKTSSKVGHDEIFASADVTNDRRNGVERSAREYARRWGWSPGSVLRFVNDNSNFIDFDRLNTDGTHEASINAGADGAAEQGQDKRLAKVSRTETEQAQNTDGTHEASINAGADGAAEQGQNNGRTETEQLFNKERKKETCVLFDQFYAAYPKHQNKPAAEKAFNKLNPSTQLFNQMMDALDWQTKQPEWLKNNGQFIPLPASWLNGRRWEDERLDTQTATTSQPQNTKPRLQVSL